MTITTSSHSVFFLESSICATSYLWQVSILSKVHLNYTGEIKTNSPEILRIWRGILGESKKISPSWKRKGSCGSGSATVSGEFHVTD
jgi:hypothetical protein